jgi:chemotaxis methyl-accepting protein methylase
VTSALEQLAAVVSAESGIALGPDRHRALSAAARRAAPGLADEALLAAIAEPNGGPTLLRSLIDEVTVNETFFFRQMEELGALDWHAMLAAARHAGAPGLRIWVAGCSTGEEAYTLAMLASEALGPAPVSILATDISTDALQRANAGRYRRRSVRGIGGALRARYFQSQGDELVAGEQLRSLVTFARHNLTRDAMPPLGEAPFDLVTCRNVLIYFDRPTVDRVAAALARATRPGGRLILGAADRISGARAPAPAPAARAARPRPRPSTKTTARRPKAARAAAAPGPAGAPGPTSTEGLAAALEAADAGRLDAARDRIAAVLATDPMNADAHFVRGLIALGSGDAAGGVESLRRALYIDPELGHAAFELGRAHERGGDTRAAALAYQRALRALEREPVRRPSAAEDVDPRDIAAVCRMRLRALAEAA